MTRKSSSEYLLWPQTQRKNNKWREKALVSTYYDLKLNEKTTNDEKKLWWVPIMTSNSTKKQQMTRKSSGK